MRSIASDTRVLPHLMIANKYLANFARIELA